MITPRESELLELAARYERSLAAFADAIVLWTTEITADDFS